MIHATRTALTLSVTLAGAVVCQSASAQVSEQKLGQVHFQNSCTPAASALFEEGMLYQHSFWYRSSQQAFESALKADPGCAIAYWGIALSLLLNPHAAPPVKNLADGAAVIAKGREAGARTQRERDYIEALAAMYTDTDKVDHRTRVSNYLNAMEQLAARYPDDDEARIFYALALNVGASAADKTYANQLKGAAILEPIWDRKPDHPGIAHYLIHLYDTPALAEKGLAAARRYAQVAPDAPHALHMPSHIFTRVGYWQDSINSNLASSRVAKAANDYHDQLHGMDYLVYAYLQLGQDEKAKAVIDEMSAVSGFNKNFLPGSYAQAASPARYVIERGDWPAAAALEVAPGSMPNVPAITWFAKALGAARTADVPAAQAAIAKLNAARDELRAKKDNYWAEQVDIQSRIASAWMQYATGQANEALQALSAAADAEDRTEKHPVTPGQLTPARELLGTMLLEQGKDQEALVAFRAVLGKEPRRLNATLGAARAAERAGDTATARKYFAAAADLASDASVTRPEVLAARAYLTKG